jgi:Arc/MetJ-type ribon-helix-helix transcriptional regulator
VATISPPQKSGIERALDWYDNQYVLTKFLSGWHGLRLASGSFPAGAGLTFGAGFTQRALGSRYAEANQPNRVDLNAVAATSTRGYHRVRGDIGFLNVGGAPVDVNVLGQYYEFPLTGTTPHVILICITEGAVSLTVRLSPKTERALNALAKRRRLSRSDVVREALARYEAGEGSGEAGGRPYDAWLDVIGVVSLGVRDPARTTGEQFTAIVRQHARTRRAR